MHLEKAARLFPVSSRLLFGFHINIYPYLFNHRTTFEYKSNIDGALMVCSLGGIMPT
jgi:hypothetical protein